MSCGQRAAVDRKILAEDIDLTAIHCAPSGDDAVAGDMFLLHPEISAAVGDEHVVFFEGSFVQQQLNPLSRRQLALGVLTVDPALAAA